MPRKSTAAKAAEAEAKVVAKVHSAVDDVADAQVARVEETRRATLHPVMQFPLVATLSFTVWSVGYALLGRVRQGELAALTRSQDTWAEVSLLVGWRLVELGIGWFGKLDSWDVAMMDVLSHGPALYLLMTFYALNPWTAGMALLVDALSSALPFYFLRPLSTVHTSGADSLPNRELIDVGLQLYTAVFSAAIYTVTIVLSLRFVLPRIFVLYFTNMVSVEHAYTASYAAIVPVTLLFGAAASTFIYAPFVTTPAKAKDGSGSTAPAAQFDPASASFSQTLEWNVWGYAIQTKVVIRRTVLTMIVTGVNTYLSLTLNIYGVESAGATAYAAVWMLAALCSGLGLHFVGRD